MVEAQFVPFQVQEPAKKKVVVELFAERALTAHRAQRHQQRGFKQPLGRNRWAADRALHLVEHRREYP